MKLLVTGASGFLGRYVVAGALRRGHEVRAMVRPSARADWPDAEGLQIVRADLRSRAGLADALRAIDAVLHLAAAKSGDIYMQYAGTVVATENLLAAMDEAGVRRIVHVSSLSVYDYLRLPAGATLDESSPLEVDAFERDAYAHTKLVQERLVRTHADRERWAWVVLRPGVLWGRDNWFTARIGLRAGDRRWARIGTWTRLPLTYVENCADAIVMAAESDAVVGQILNVIDDEPPTVRRYVSLIRTAFHPSPRVLPVPWVVARAVARLAELANRLLLKNRAKVPGMLVPARLHARCKPLQYSNRRIKEVLGWRPRFGLEEAMWRSLSTQHDPAHAVGGATIDQPDVRPRVDEPVGAGPMAHLRVRCASPASQEATVS